MKQYLSCFSFANFLTLIATAAIPTSGNSASKSMPGRLSMNTLIYKGGPDTISA